MSKEAQNYLDLIPVRTVEEFSKEEEKITLLIPKFKSEWARKWLIPSRRSPYFKVHLDAMGSKVWELIDGKRNTGEICAIMGAETPDDEQLPLRITKFMTNLYKSRFIKFKQTNP